MEHSGEVHSAGSPQTLSAWRRILVFLQLNTYYTSRFIIGCYLATAFAWIEYLLASAVVAEGSSGLFAVVGSVSIFLFVLWSVYYRLVSAPKNAMKTLCGMRCNVSDIGVEIASSNSRSFAEWSLYTRWLAVPQAWALVLPNGSVNVIGRSNLDPTTAERIETLLASHLPQGKTVRGRAHSFDAVRRVLFAIVGTVAVLIYVPYTFHTAEELRRSWVYERDAFCQTRSWSELIRGPIAGTSACTRETVTLIGGKWNPALPVNRQEVQVAQMDAGVQILTLFEPRGTHDFFDDVTRISPAPAVVQLIDNLPVLLVTKHPGPYNTLIRYPFADIPTYFDTGNRAAWIAIVLFFCLLTTPLRRRQRSVAPQAASR
jgi:hypothetical protein